MLSYNGLADFICNSWGNRDWLHSLQWGGQSQFQQAANKTWTVAGAAAGWSKSANVAGAGWLDFVGIEHAGHLVPHDKPEQALAMLDTVLAGKPF